MKLFTFIIIAGMAFCAYAQDGPGGIGNSDGSGNQPENSLWLKSDSISGLTSGSSVTNWLDVSGNSNDASQAAVDRRPLYLTNEINGKPVVRLDGLDSLIGDFMTVSDADNLDDTDGLSIFVLVKPQSLGFGIAEGLISKRETGDVNDSYSLFFGAANRLNIDLDTGNNRFPLPFQFQNGTWYLTEMIYDGTLVSTQRIKTFNSGVPDTVVTEFSTSIPNYNSDLNIGYLTNVGGETTLGADLAEIIIFRDALNDAQRTIVENYINASYNVVVGNDLYAGDSPGNGNYDHGLIGVGLDSTGSHNQGQIDGLVLQENAFLVDDGDYAMAAHNSGANSHTSADVPSSVEERWSRIWYIDRTDGGESAHGNITIGFDFSESEIGSNPVGLASFYQLLYRSGTTGDFSIVTVSSATIAGDQVIFEVSDGNFTDGYYTLGREDNAPTVANDIDDVTVIEDASNTVINLSNVFTDVDNEDNLITKSVEDNTNSTLVTASITNNTLTLNYQANQFGTADITIRGTSNGLFVDDVFQVTVTPDDDAPTIASQISDVTADEDDDDVVIDLSTVFTDIDNDDNLITKAVQGNTNPTMVIASIDGNDLTLEFQTEQSGEATIAIRGNSNGKFVDDAFLVTVSAVDDSPTVAIQINDVNVLEDADNTSIDLTNIFTDIDNNDALIAKSVQLNTNSTLVSASITDNTLTLDYQLDQSGTADITIRGTSNGLFVDDIFQVTVTGEDDAPTVAIEISDVAEVEDAANTVIDLTTIFTDVDNDDNLIVKSVQLNTNTTLVDASISGDNLTLDYQLNQSGTADITIRGTSGGQFVDDVFQVVVTAEDDLPTVANEIADVTVAEDAANTVIDLSNVFDDIDNDNNLITKTVETNTNSTLVNASITDNTLTLDYQLNQTGQADITIRGTSGGQFVDDVFVVTVTGDDDLPTVANAIGDVSVAEDAVNTDIDLTNVFTDVDNDDNLITKTVQANTNSTLVAASITDNTLTLDYQPDQAGTANITIRGTSNGLFVDDVFLVTVTAEDDAPIVAVEIGDVSVGEDAENTVIDLASVFTDIDNDNNLIVKTVQTNTNSTLVDASILGNTLTLDFQPNQVGTADITIRGTSGGQFVDDVFQVIVTADDDAPTVANAIEDVSVDEDAANTEIDLSTVFSDVDNDDNLITKTVENNTNPTLVTASVTDNTLTLDYQPDITGTADVTIRGTSNGKTVDDTFTVTVQSVNDPPVISDLVDQVFNEDDSLVYSIPGLYDLVTDPDHPDSLLTFLPVAGGKSVFIELDLPNIILKAPANWFGHDTLKIAVIDPELASDTATIYIEVKSVNDAPTFSEFTDPLEMIVETETMLTMSDYVVDNDLPDDNLSWEITSSPDGLQLQFDAESTELTLTAPAAAGTFTVQVSVTDDSSATAVESFEVNVTLDPTSIEDLAGDIPTVYSLEQNYPNPFNPSTHIKYGLPDAGEVLVEVYNLLGQKVITLFDGYQAAGYHILDFEANSLPTGIYFYRIQTKEFQSIKKMMLIK
jgi:uncharacterized protein YqfB (UPF0267 family)